MNKAISRTFVFTALGAVVVGGGVGAAVAYFLLNKTDKDNNVGGATYHFDKDGQYIEDLSKPYYLEVVQYMTKNPMGDYEYYLNRDGVKSLVNQFLTRGNYGPEIQNLKRIYISNVNMTSDKENGVYIGSTNEIGLNGKTFLQRLDANNELHNSYYSQNLRVELMFETLFHEYGHHIAYSYPSSPLEVSIDPSIFQTYADGSRRINPWSSKFVERFKTLLKYDLPSAPLYKDNKWTDENGYRSLGAIFNPYELFRRANSQLIDFGTSAYSKDKFILGATGIGLNNTILGSWPKVSKDELSYYYSMEELFARKYMLATMPASQDTITLFGNRIVSGMLSDELNYETPTSKAVINQSPAAVGFLSDNPFDTFSGSTLSSQGLYDLLDETMGHKTGDDISFIWSKNSYNIVKDKVIESDPSNKGESKMIRFGGYISETEADLYKAVGYKNDKGEVVKIPMTTKNFKLRYKTNLYDSLTNSKTLSAPDKFFYTTDDFVDANSLLDKKLGFVDEQGNFVPFHSIRNNQYGVASSYASQLPSGIFSNNLTRTFYKAKIDGDSVRIVDKTVSVGGY